MKKRVLPLFLLSVFLLAGCDTLEEVPSSQLSPSNFFETPQDAEAAVIGTYAQMKPNRRYSHHAARLVNMPNPYLLANNNQHRVFSSFSYDATSGSLVNMWFIHYNAIDAASAAVENIPQVDGMDEEQQNALIGEVRFIRALHYFNLVRLWGSVPLAKEATKSTEGLDKAGAPIGEIYAFIVEDLMFAADALPAGRQAGGPDGAGDLGRVTAGAANALLGKVYLTMAGEPLNDDSKLQLAKERLQRVVDSGAYELLDDVKSIFALDNELNEEIIFAVGYEGSGGQGQGNLLAKQYMPPRYSSVGGGGGYKAGYHEDFYAKFDSTDERRNELLLYQYCHWRGCQHLVTYGDPDDPIGRYEPPRGIAQGKFIDTNQNCCNGDTDVPLLRYADVFLMLAEAENEISGPSAEVFNYLNELRERAGAPLFDASADLEGNAWTKESLRHAILMERFRELFFEFKAVYDIRRMGKTEWAVENSYDAQKAGVTYDPKLDLYPIPQRALDQNPSLEQNPGY